MPHPTTLTIPQPCAESWAAMTPTAAGRHCAACQQTVVDFTLKTDAEILAYLAGAAGGRTCGRFAAGQLGRPLQRAVPAAPGARWRAWLAAAVAVWGLRAVAPTSARAQAPSELPRKMSAAGPGPLRTQQKPLYEGAGRPATLRGVVRDSITHEGLPGVSVLIRNTTVGVATGADGSFELPVSGELARAEQVELEVRYLGYVPQERVIVASSLARAVELYLQPDVKGMLSGEVVMGGLVVQGRRPWPWHPRSCYRWARFWLTRPFRRS